MFDVFKDFPWVAYIIIGLLGLIFGSFFTFLFYRLKSGDAILVGEDAKRSKCPICAHTLTWCDLIPILSWCINKGHCRHCRAPISIRYPLIEIVTAIIFLLIYSIYQG